MDKLYAAWTHTSGAGQMKNLASLAVTKNDDILVADSDNNRILSINSSLGSIQELALSVDGGIHYPRGLCLDESRGRLCVGEWDGDYRVWVFDGIHLWPRCWPKNWTTWNLCSTLWPIKLSHMKKCTNFYKSVFYYIYVRRVWHATKFYKLTDRVPYGWLLKPMLFLYINESVLQNSGINGDSSLVWRVICPKRIGIGLGLTLTRARRTKNFGICTTPFWTNDTLDSDL